MGSLEMATQSTLLDLTRSLTQQLQQITAHLEELSHPELSFAAESKEPPSTDKYEELRVGINTAALDLVRLVNGPRQTFRNELLRHYDLAAYQVALNADVLKKIPRGGHATVSELAEKTGLNADQLRRIMQFLATQRICKQVATDGGDIAFEHTAASALLLKEPGLHDTFAWQTDEMFQAASMTKDALQKPMPQSAFVERFGLRTYDWYAKHEDKGARFARSMKAIKTLDRQADELCDGYNWKSLPPGVVVDIGGGSGHVSRDLAEKYDHLKFVVQDIGTNMLKQGATHWEGAMADRVEFMHHDFFKPQPITNASAYFTRQVTHNLSETEMVDFFRAQVPALEKSPKGTPFLVNDLVLPEPGEKPAYEEYSLRQMDILVMVCFNSKQRTASDLKDLLHQADPRLSIAKVHRTGTMGLVEIQLNAE